MNKQEVDRFKAKVSMRGNNECWPWSGAKTPTGYGNFRSAGITHKAHRIAWEIENFKIPPGYVVMHLCDNPSCCNPNHLVLGTRKANTADMILKGRSGMRKNKAAGEKNGNSRLKKGDVEKINKLLSISDLSQSSIAKKFGVTQSTISRISLHKTWRPVDECK